MQQISRGKFDRLQRTAAGFTCTRLDGYGLRCSLPTRPRVQASYPVLVHQRTLLLHASFRPRLATTPLRFANPSPPSGWIRDSHPQTVEHARHTMTEYGKHGKPKSRLSTGPTLFGNPFGITTIPRPPLLAYFDEQQQERPNPSSLDLKGLVTDVPVHSPLSQLLQLFLLIRGPGPGSGHAMNGCSESVSDKLVSRHESHRWSRARFSVVHSLAKHRQKQSR
jgi:hypothetical protein